MVFFGVWSVPSRLLSGRLQLRALSVKWLCFFLLVITSFLIYFRCCVHVSYPLLISAMLKTLIALARTFSMSALAWYGVSFLIYFGCCVHVSYPLLISAMLKTLIALARTFSMSALAWYGATF